MWLADWTIDVWFLTTPSPGGHPASRFSPGGNCDCCVKASYFEVVGIGGADLQPLQFVLLRAKSTVNVLLVLGWIQFSAEVRFFSSHPSALYPDFSLSVVVQRALQVPYNITNSGQRIVRRNFNGKSLLLLTSYLVTGSPLFILIHYS